MGSSIHKEIDRILAEAEVRLNWLGHIEPAHLEAKKRKFLDEGIEPALSEFALEIGFDLEKTGSALEELEIPSDALGTLLERKREELLVLVAILSARGTELVRDLSVELFGKPSDELVAKATDILMQNDEGTASSDFGILVSDEEMRLRVEEEFARLGIQGWKCELSGKRSNVTVFAPQRKVLIPLGREFDELEAQRLLVHEVGVHVFRGYNGSSQRVGLSLFTTGLAGYMKTEEGLASYSEKESGLLDHQTLRKYAARVIAVSEMLEGKTFTEVFLRMKSFGFSDDVSWMLAVRVFRGGGFAKDHVYFEGLLAVEEFAENGGDLRELFVGKVGLEDLELVRELISKGELELR